MELTVRAVLAGIPGWEDATATELKGGLTNQTWLVDNGTAQAVLKFDESPRGAPYNTRRTEARIQAAAAELGLANDVLLATDTVYMSEYREGVVWSVDCLGDVANIEKLAIALRRLHSLPLTGRIFDAQAAAQGYARRIADGDTGRIRECLQIVAAGTLPQNLCCCHNDLVVENIVNVPEIRFLDWEYACDNDPFFDLATIAAHHGLTQRQQDTLLNAYFDGDGARWRAQLDRQARIYDALLYLWQNSREG